MLALLIAALCLAAPLPVRAQSAADLDDPQAMAAFLEGAFAAAMLEHHVPGAVAVVVKDGAVLHAAGYGYADLETPTPVDPATTLFRPGSVSKLFTWTAVMQMVEAGQLDLDADINRYLDFEIPSTFPQPITLRHLLTHTPGFEDQGQGLFKLDPAEMISLGEYLKRAIPARVYPPGEIAAYSNYGSILAGYIVERVSGMPFTAYVETHILAPLGMEHATFQQPLPPNLQADMAGGYNYLNGEYLRGSFELVVGSPAGGLSASGLDMARFMIAHLQHGEYNGARILQEDTAQQMHSPLYSPDPRIDCMAHGFFYQHINGQYTLSHGGDTMLFHSSLRLLPEHNLGIFISTNGTNGSMVVETVTKAFMDRYFPVEAAELTPTADFAERAALYRGNYISARSNVHGLEKILNLMTPTSVSITPDNRVVLNYAGQATSFIEVEPGLLVDPLDPDNRIVMHALNGRVRLSPPMPFEFLKIHWYETSAFQGVLFVGGLLMFLGAGVGFISAFLRRRKAHEPVPAGSRLARWTAALFGMALLLFLVGFLVVFSDIDPALGVPTVFFADPGTLPMLLVILPLVLVALGALMVVFAAAAWRKRWWSAGGRACYSLLALWALGLVWALAYWNLLF
jgi:CubicO group peptidase (beta-lactamase class C family)